MKTLKITFLLLAVLLLTVSGQSSDTTVTNDEPTYKQYDNNNLFAHKREKAKLETQG
ncbi:hypothetical protein AB9K26_14580 [Psychroserpens sp. XS_ASV72]|uniref:hypothetical protein n=1 Tax=Psychroserpens sp. XS_ASV72 TaxID=3241293 RepID=UPI0035133CC4